MKKRYLLPCIMLIICMMLTACTTPSQNISNNTPPATEQPATEQPTTAPDTEAPESSTPEPNSELDCFDRDMVLAFLETEDENGVKNGEKINPAYNPLDYNTWHFGSRGQNCNGFYFNGDGRLSYVALRGVLNYSGKLVGELNLETCYRLHYLFVESQNIESIKLSSEFDILKVIDCPELLVISAEEASVRYCTIENCPNVKWFMWNVDGTLTEFWDGTVNYGVNCREAVERYDMEVNHIHAPDRSGDKRRQKVEMFFNFVDEVEIPRAGRTNDCRIYPWTQKNGVTSTVTPFSALTAGQIVSYDC